jgi:hypothetical protein
MPPHGRRRGHRHAGWPHPDSRTGTRLRAHRPDRGRPEPALISAIAASSTTQPPMRPVSMSRCAWRENPPPAPTGAIREGKAHPAPCTPGHRDLAGMQVQRSVPELLYCDSIRPGNVNSTCPTRLRCMTPPSTDPSAPHLAISARSPGGSSVVETSCVVGRRSSIMVNPIVEE